MPGQTHLAEKLHRTDRQPAVGIFWLLDGKLIIDSTPLGDAENYDHFRIHPGDHISVWQRLQQDGTAPSDMEYEESARGRVVYNTKSRQFTLLADKCILKDRSLVTNIMSELKLPKTTKTGTDDHYRCSRCLRMQDR